jgi:glycosyltransferase involved in cell wall biosynthesis
MSVDLETTHHGITILICCHNSRSRMPAVLEHLLRQDAPATIGWEVLVIDNASSDATSDVAKSVWPDSHPTPLRVVLEPNVGLTNARNKGIAEAKYDIISFVDDDNWVGPDFVRTVHSLMQNRPEMGACGCRIEEACEVDPPDWFNAFKLGLAGSVIQISSFLAPDCRSDKLHFEISSHSDSLPPCPDVVESPF